LVFERFRPPREFAVYPADLDVPAFVDPFGAATA
jgi:hypothetical protein